MHDSMSSSFEIRAPRVINLQHRWSFLGVRLSIGWATNYPPPHFAEQSRDWMRPCRPTSRQPVWITGLLAGSKHLERQLAEAREQQTATSEVLNVV